ncbi:MAG: hypothetical protein SHS37scaffold220_31 [Phage 67_12]|nr:MAG: hypothetical protein SHS37scaffold220_31 [Phage 67_12]
MTLAFKTALPSTQKFVLVALCDSANDQGECYPSVPSLAEKCSLSERAVQGAIASLQDCGCVRREFRNGRSTVYWVDPTPAVRAPLPKSSTPAATAPQGRTSFTPAAGAPPQQVHPTPADPAPTPPQQVHPTPADPAPITVKEPSVEPSGKRKRAPSAPDTPRPDDVTETVWRDWCALRKAKRTTASETAVNGAREEAKLAGLTLDRFLAVWCVRGSQGLQASWLKPEERSQAIPRRGGSATDADLAALNAASDAEARRRLFGSDQETIDA